MSDFPEVQQNLRMKDLHPNSDANRFRELVDIPDTKFRKQSNEGPIAETRLGKEFVDRWWFVGKDGYKYDIQEANPNHPRKDTISIDGQEKQVTVEMRIWKTRKVEGETTAMCYSLVRDESGKEQWIVENTDEPPSFDNKTKINTWNIRDPRYANKVEMKQLETSLKRLSKGKKTLLKPPADRPL